MTLTADEIAEDRPLTDQQMLFVDHYMSTMNQMLAYKMAGYTGEEHSLAVNASKLMRIHKIAREVDRRLKNFTMSSNEVLVRLTDIARADIGNAIDENGNIDPQRMKRAGQSHLIKKIKRRSYTTMDIDGNERVVHETEIELHDSLEALTRLAKFHGLLVTRIQVDDWQSQAIEDIRQGRIAYKALAQTFDVETAKQLFLRAGVAISKDSDTVEGEYSETTSDEDSTTVPVPTVTTEPTVAPVAAVDTVTTVQPASATSTSDAPLPTTVLATGQGSSTPRDTTT